MAGLTEYVRVFTGIELSAETRNALDEDATALLDGLGRASRVVSGNYHVTMKFVGEVHRDDLPALGQAVAAGAERLVAGPIEIEGLGAFPRLSRPRVIWAGVSDPSGILTPVHDYLNEALAGFGAKRERKRYVPHVTLARVRGPFDAAGLARRMEEQEEWWFGSERVRRITLYMSELGGGGPPRYTVLGHYPAE